MRSNTRGRAPTSTATWNRNISGWLGNRHNNSCDHPTKSKQGLPPGIMNPSEGDDPHCRRMVVGKRSSNGQMRASPASSKRMKTIDLIDVASSSPPTAAEETKTGSLKGDKESARNSLVRGSFGALYLAAGKTSRSSPLPAQGSREEQSRSEPNATSMTALVEDDNRASASEPSKYLVKFTPRCPGKGPHSSQELRENRVMLNKELQLLCSFRHDRIAKLHLISSGPSSEPHVVIDRVVETLEDKFKVWHGRSCDDLRERLRVVHSIASALDYLHDKKIVFRGLDPSTVGFNEQDSPILFNFCLAREIPQDSQKKMTAMTGSSRNYIAPCNYLGEAYGLSSDVYSFCILFWEVLSRQRAFLDVADDADYLEMVVKGRKRPEIPFTWPLLLRNILRFGWARRTATRPTAKVIQAALGQHLFGSEVGSPLIEYIQCMLLSNGTFTDL